jgi:hypothetical protein
MTCLSIEVILTAVLGKKSVIKKMTWQRSARLHKLDFGHSKNKCSRAN